MKTPDIKAFLRTTHAFVDKHSPAILTGVGVAGFTTTVVLAVKATPAALRDIEAKKAELDVDELTPVDTIKATWKRYIPAFVTGVASATCLISASSVSAKRTAALAAAYELSETALSEYREKVVEKVGETKEKAIRDEVNKDRVEKHPVKQAEVIHTERGKTLCFDVWSSRYFRSDRAYIERTINNLNARMLSDPFGSVSLNDFYFELGLESTKTGDTMGWNISNGQIREDYSSVLSPDGEPCLVIDFLTPPEYGFDRIA